MPTPCSCCCARLRQSGQHAVCLPLPWLDLRWVSWLLVEPLLLSFYWIQAQLYRHVGCTPCSVPTSIWRCTDPNLQYGRDPFKHTAFVLCCVADTRGRLVKATRLKGIQDFKAGAFGLHPIAVDTWGHFVFLHLQGGGPVGQGAAVQAPLGVAEWLGIWMGHCPYLGIHVLLLKLLIVIIGLVGFCGPCLSTHAHAACQIHVDDRVGWQSGREQAGPAAATIQPLAHKWCSCQSHLQAAHFVAVGSLRRCVMLCRAVLPGACVVLVQVLGASACMPWGWQTAAWFTSPGRSMC